MDMVSGSKHQQNRPGYYTLTGPDQTMTELYMSHPHKDVIVVLRVAPLNLNSIISKAEKQTAFIALTVCQHI